MEISVTDTGIGIAEKEMPKLFEAFERLDTHLRVKAGGTGLGLYLTKKTCYGYSSRQCLGPEQGGAREHVYLKSSQRLASDF